MLFEILGIQPDYEKIEHYICLIRCFFVNYSASSSHNGGHQMISKSTIINRLAEALKPLPFIHALWLEGADATGTADEYSDIDFWLDFEDDYEQQAIEVVEHALSGISKIDYKYVMQHGHPKIRQRIYHLANTNEYLMIDFCWQMHSRVTDGLFYIENDNIEPVKIIFDKSNVILYKPLNHANFEEDNAFMLAKAKYRRTQYLRAEKYFRRGRYLESYAYYNQYILEPLVDLLRLIYTPTHAEYGFTHISLHIPAAKKEKLEYFAKLSSLEDIAERIPLAGAWFDELLLEFS